MGSSKLPPFEHDHTLLTKSDFFLNILITEGILF